MGTWKRVLTNNDMAIDSSGHVTFTGDLKIAHKVMHSGDEDNYHEFTTDVQNFATSGTNALSLDANQNATFGGTINSGAITSTGEVKSINQMTCEYSDISTGTNRGLKLLNTSGTDQQWNITAGVTGSENESFCIRDSTAGVNVLTMAMSSGDAIFSGTITTSDMITANEVQCDTCEVDGNPVLTENTQLDDISGNLPVTKGGTGASTASAARTNLGLGSSNQVTFGEVAAGTIEVSGEPVLHEGTVLNDISGTLQSSKLDADTAHLSGAQIFTGTKTFSSGIVQSGSGVGVSCVSTQSSGLVCQGGGNNTDIATFKNTSGTIVATIRSGGTKIGGGLGVGTSASSTTGEIRATNEITAFYSDDRLKDKIGIIDKALDKVSKIEGFYYTPNDVAQELGYEPIENVGLSAQSVKEILPHAVVPAPIDEKYLTIKYEKVIPLLVNAINELSEKVEYLEAKV